MGKNVARPPLLVFADDWGRHPSSCQHLMRQFLGRYEIFWVNTIGMRTPRFDLATVHRGWEKLRSWMSRRETPTLTQPGPHVASPRMWPWFSSGFDRWLNRLLLGRQLRALIRTMPAPPIAVTTLPIVADLIDLLPVQRWVYYCVDDFSLWPRLDHGPMFHMEEQLVHKADVLFAVSETLRAKFAAMGRDAHLLTHGIDRDHWASGSQGGPTLPELNSLERPLVVFWGLVDRRMDVALVERLASDLTRGTVVLVGPELHPDPALRQIPRVVRLPAIPYEQLPSLAQQAAVLIMPYADLPVTRAIQPLKLKEYLATGKPTVARDLPAVRSWADCLDVVRTAEDFSKAVRLRLVDGLPPAQQQARGRLVQESWSAKALAFEEHGLTGAPFSRSPQASANAAQTSEEPLNGNIEA